MLSSGFLRLTTRIKKNFSTKFFKKACVSFTVFAFFSSFACIDAVDQEFASMQRVAAQIAATKYKKTTEELQSQLEELKLQQVSGGTHSINVADITKTMQAHVKEGLTRGDFDSPVKKANKGQPGTPGNPNLLQEIGKIVIEIDPADKTPVALIQSVQAEFLNQLGLVFKQYAERKQQSSSNGGGLALIVRDGNSPVMTAEVDVDSILRAFRLAAIGILDPNIAQLLKDCQLRQAQLVVMSEPAAPVMDLKKEGARYVQKIKIAIDREGTLYDLAQQYRPEISEEVSEKHEMLGIMLDYNIEQVATQFKAKKATTLIEIGEELRDRFFDTALLTFVHYISGNTNKTNVSEIIALTNGGRGQNIPEIVLRSLHSELYEIFYPRRQSGSFTITRYEFEREGRNTSRRQQLVIGGWNLPVINTVADVAGTLVETLFGNCMVSSQNLLTNGDDSSTGSNSRLAIQGSNDEEL